MTTASTSIYDDIREKIMSGAYAPGQTLTETALATEYGVSRTPIREALHSLEREGFIDRVGKRLVVAAHTPEEVLELYEFRALLEESAARWSASRRTELDLSRLIYLHEQMKESEDTSVASRVESNQGFHAQLWKSSHNARLVKALQLVFSQLHRHPETTIEVPGRWDQVLEEHEQIVQAITAGDIEGSVSAVRQHMNGARDVRLRLLSSD